MISVLLADDNKIALERFAHLVNWEALGFHLADTALNGIEAFQKFEQLKPELVITEVQMPGMDVLELARKIRAVSPETMIVFLSSHDEFDYARAAIDLNVHDYILKHELDRQKMTDKLLSIRGILKQRMTQRYNLLDRHLYLYFHANVADLDIVLDHSDASIYGDFRFFILEQDHVPEPIARLTGCQRQEVDYPSVLPDLLAQSIPELHLVRFAPYRWVGLHPAGSVDLAAVQRIKENAESRTRCSFTLILFHAHGSLLDCRCLYEKYRFLFEQKYFEHAGSSLYAELYEPPVHANGRWVLGGRGCVLASLHLLQTVANKQGAASRAAFRRRFETAPC